ncbi:MAG: PAS domain-containing protein [Pseudomonadota bacterium]
MAILGQGGSGRGGSTPRFEGLDAFERYWDLLRGRDAVPKRSDVEARQLESLLDRTFILEKVAPRVARLRVAGQNLCDCMGMDVRGMPITAMIMAESRPVVADALAHVFETPCKLHLDLTAERSIGKPPLEGQILILPLASDSGEINRAMGIFATRGRLGRAPRRFKCLARPDLTVISDLESLIAPAQVTPLPAAVAKKRPFAHRSHLRLVYSRDTNL